MDATPHLAEPAPTSVNSAPSAIDARGLRRSYGDRVAVQELDLQVERGTVLGFLGPNGAGKTTVIRMLSTVLRPDSGRFSVAGRPHSDPTAIRRRIGVLPESAGYPTAQSAEEYLVYHARLFGADRRSAGDTARRLLTEVGLADRAGSRIAALSRGLRQRLGIARALVNDPEVLFLDEPTLGLDPGGQRQVLGLVARIAREHGVTVVLSTHTLAEVEQICNRVVILNRGRIVADGTVREVVRRAAAPRRALVRVPVDRRGEAVALLNERGITAVERSQGGQDELEVVLPDAPRAPEAPDAPGAPEAADGADDHSASIVLRSLLDADVPVLAFSLEGGRLSDAFLAVTEDGGSHG